MPEIRDGLQVAGESGGSLPDAFDHAGKTRPTEEAAHPDPAAATEAEIKAALRNPELTLDLPSGISVKGEEPAPAKLEDIGAVSIDGHAVSGKEVHHALTSAGLELDGQDAEREAGQDALVELALERFRQATAEAIYEGDEGGIAAAASDLRGSVPKDVYENALFEAVEQYEGLTADEADDDGLDALDETFDSLDQRANAIEGLRQAIDADQAARQLLPKAAEQRAAEIHGTVKNWARDQGFKSDAEANEAWQAAKQFAKTELGYDLSKMEESIDGFDSKVYSAVLRSSHAALAEDTRAQASRRFQQAVVDEGDTSVANGYTVMTPWGPMPTVDTDLGPAELDSDRVVARAQMRRDTADAIKASVAAESNTSVADGLRDASGKKTTMAEASGAAERERRARAEAVEIDRARFGGAFR